MCYYVIHTLESIEQARLLTSASWTNHLSRTFTYDSPHTFSGHGVENRYIKHGSSDCNAFLQLMNKENEMYLLKFGCF